MCDALRPVIGKRVIRIRAGLYRIKSGVKIVTRRRTHWRCLKTSAELHPRFGQGIDVRRVRLSAVTADVAKRAIIGNDKHQVWTR